MKLDLSLPSAAGGHYTESIIQATFPFASSPLVTVPTDLAKRILRFGIVGGAANADYRVQAVLTLGGMTVGGLQQDFLFASTTPQPAITRQVTGLSATVPGIGAFTNIQAFEGTLIINCDTIRLNVFKIGAGVDTSMVQFLQVSSMLPI